MRLALRTALFALAMSVAVFAAPDDNTCNISFVVVRNVNGKPIRNAAVVLHPVDKNGKQKRNGVELKTDSEGRTNFPALPYGKVRVQVLAPGFQTFGEDYDVKEKTMEIEVKLKKPQEQYSIYDEKNKDKDKDKDKDKEPKK